MRTRRSLGIGDLGDVVPTARWLKHAGVSLVQILPMHQLPDLETSPYGALTAFAIDPIYVDLRAVPELAGNELEQALGQDGYAALERAEGAHRVDYPTVRHVKRRALEHAYGVFAARHPKGSATPRRAAFEAYSAAAASWLEPFCQYMQVRRLHVDEVVPVAVRDERWDWRAWDSSARSLDWYGYGLAAMGEFAARIRYEQWVLAEQWTAMREGLAGIGVELMGDLPFVVSRQSADVWLRPLQFRAELSLGAPPDDFSADGQDWGLPPYDWREMDADGLGWIRARARRAGELYDRFRLDHLVGFYRQYVREPGRLGSFDPPRESDQIARGENVLRAMLDSAAPSEMIAEDLGAIPTSVRESMARLGLPGYRVLPWERDATEYRDPARFPARSVACWSTHDTAPITAWWDEFTPEDRARLASRMEISPNASGDPLWEAQAKYLLNASSDLALLLVQEILGDRARINVPGTVGESNWSYRLPRSVEDFLDDDLLSNRLAKLGDAARLARRVAG